MMMNLERKSISTDSVPHGNKKRPYFTRKGSNFGSLLHRSQSFAIGSSRSTSSCPTVPGHKRNHQKKRGKIISVFTSDENFNFETRISSFINRDSIFEGSSEKKGELVETFSKQNLLNQSEDLGRTTSFLKQVEEVEKIIRKEKEKIGINPTITRETDTPSSTRSNETRKSSKREQIKKRIIKTKEKSVKARLDRRIEELHENPDELRKLRVNIRKYEKRMVKKKAKNRKTDYVKINKSVAYNNEKESTLKSAFRLRETRLRKAREKRMGIVRSNLSELSRLEKKINDKISNASVFHENLQKYHVMTERKLKLMFLITFFSRFSVFNENLKISQKRRIEEKKIRIFSKFVQKHLLPLIIDKRSEKWGDSFSVFRKYFIFFRLWLTVKRKKDSISIIKRFLEDTNSALKLVRQVKMFTYRMKNCQFYIQKRLKVKSTRKFVLLFKYKIVEAKILNSMKLQSSSSTKFVFSPKTKRRRMKREGKDEKSSSKEDGGFDEKTFRYKDEVDFSFFDKTKNLEDEKQAAGYLCFVVPPEKVKMKIIKDYIRDKEIKFEREKKEYFQAIKEYESLKKQRELDEKVKNIWKEGKDDENDKKVEDEDALKKPQKKILRIFISEEEMKELVVKGFQIAREKEREIYEGGSERKTYCYDELDEIEKKHIDDVKTMDFSFRKRFSSVYGNYYLMFDRAHKIVERIRAERKKTFQSWVKANQNVKESASKIKKEAESK